MVRQILISTKRNPSKVLIDMRIKPACLFDQQNRIGKAEEQYKKAEIDQGHSIPIIFRKPTDPAILIMPRRIIAARHAARNIYGIRTNAISAGE